MNILLCLLGIDRNADLRGNRNIVPRPQRPEQAREFVRLEPMRALLPFRYQCSPATVIKRPCAAYQFGPNPSRAAQNRYFLQGIRP